MRKTRSGQSIVEVVIATTLISIGIIAALSLSNFSTKQNTYSKALNDATSYNNQVADWLRAQKTQLGWAAFTDKLTTDAGGGVATYCLMSLPSGADDFTALTAAPCNPTDFIDGTAYTRELQLDINNLADGRIPTTVITSWEEKVTRSATLNMELTQWQ
jgi:Tfp pilus assembly protein PilV